MALPKLSRYHKDIKLVFDGKEIGVIKKEDVEVSENLVLLYERLHESSYWMGSVPVNKCAKK